MKPGSSWMTKIRKVQGETNLLIVLKLNMLRTRVDAVFKSHAAPVAARKRLQSGQRFESPH